MLLLSRIFSAPPLLFSLFFFNATATPELYTLSLHDALPISPPCCGTSWCMLKKWQRWGNWSPETSCPTAAIFRSEEHTSELQSRQYLVCRLLLEKKKPKDPEYHYHTSVIRRLRHESNDNLRR